MRAQVVAIARSWIGTPYRHQGCLKGAGCDCLGLIRGVWFDLYGFEPEPIVPYSASWAEERREETLRDAARRHLVEIAPDEGLLGERLLALIQPGDVLLFRIRDRGMAKHATILSEPGRIVHSYDRHAVMETAIPQAWCRKLAYAFRFPGLVTSDAGCGGGT